MLSERLRFRDVRSTSSFRLTLLLGVLFLTGVMVMLGLIYVLTARELTARNDHILYEKARSLVATPSDRLPARIQSEIANDAQGFSYFALIDKSGGLVVGNISLPGVAAVDRPFNVAARPGTHGPLRILAVRTPHREIVLLGRDISQIYDLRRRIMEILISSGIVSLIGMLAVAVLISIGPLRRVRDLQRASQAIAAGNLETRMPVAGRNDELDQFATTLNHMIEEVARVIAQVKSATDAIAHDLRTPLTRVRARLHQLTTQPLPTDERQEVLAEATEDLDDLLARFSALLRISELEASARRSGLGEVDIGSLIEEVAELYGPLADHGRIALEVRAPLELTVHADRELLFEAVSNLVDNAIKFARTRVELRAVSADGGVAIEVADDGRGIAVMDREAVMRRFHRLPDAASVPGSGLGLSVVSAIMHVHGFSLDLADAAPGLLARIRM